MARSALVRLENDWVCTRKDRQKLQQTAKIGTALSVQHNAALNKKLGSLAKNLGVNIFVVDFATAFETVQSNPALFGFTNTDDACVGSAYHRRPATPKEL